MSESAAPSRISAVTSQRQALTRDLETREGVLKNLQLELKSSTGMDKHRLQAMIKDQAAAVKQAQESLHAFEHPVVLPKLQLAGIRIQFHPDNRQFDTVVLVNNNGILPSLGSFELDLSISYYTYDQDPPLLVDEILPMTTPDSTDVQPGGTNPFLFPNIPFVTKPGTASALYTFDVLLFAGPHGDVGDQTLHLEFTLKPPRFTRPIIPTGGILAQ